MSRKTVAIIGATGNQGSALLSTLLTHGGYHIRAVTRDPSAASSQALAAQGVEVVPASLTDKASLVKAFEGVYAVFGVTPNFPEEEELMGRNIVDAAKEAAVKLLVWSSLPNTRELSGGKLSMECAFHLYPCARLGG